MNTALLVMDVQQEIVERLGADVDTSAALNRIGHAVQVAREHGIPVIWVLIAFRDGYPEIDPTNRLLSGVVRREGLLRSRARTAVHASLHVQDTDVVVTKPRTDPFNGTDLAILLRAQQVSQLVLAGFTTSGVVLSTYLTAVDSDYAVTVLADCCVDRDPELHETLVSRLFPSRGVAQTVDAWRSGLSGG